MLDVTAACLIYILELRVKGVFVALLDYQHVMQSLTVTTLICQSYQATATSWF